MNSLPTNKNRHSGAQDESVKARSNQNPLPERRTLKSRRVFIGQIAGVASGMVLAETAFGPDASVAQAARKSPTGTFAPLNLDQLRQRRNDAYTKRSDSARNWFQEPFQTPLANDDELLYPDGWANFSKTLPHNSLGHPDPAAYRALVTACTSGRPEDFAAIPLGGVQPLRNPQGGLSFEFCGFDSNQTIVPPAPAFASAWRAAEMVEIYWLALLRDVPFRDYAVNPLVAAACADLTALSDFRGPKEGGVVTPNTIFRGNYPGCTVGPFVSQFLLKNIAFGAQINTQQVRTFAPGPDYLTNYSEWVARQNGAPFGHRAYDSTFRYLRDLRDIASWVDADPPLQAGYHALSILLQMGAPLDPANPYLTQIRNQDAFTTFGPVEWFDMVGRAPRPAHEAAWFQKWRVHRTLRPEEYAGRVHNHLAGAFAYPLHPDVLASQALAQTFSRQGTYLCSQAYPDGSPTHCAYPSGHSVGAGSTTTMLKAIFDETFVIPDPVEPTPDGLALQSYIGPPLTVGGELNKLAFNIGFARVAGGIHWRSDVVEGNRLGQETSLSILDDMHSTCNEPFSGYRLTRFDGTIAI